MHREATDRNVTPTTQQQVGSGSGTISPTDDTAEIDTGVEPASVHNDANMEISTSGPTLRWTSFEDMLRQRREEVLQSSIENLKKASGEAASESGRRKAS